MLFSSVKVALFIHLLIAKCKSKCKSLKRRNVRVITETKEVGVDKVEQEALETENALLVRNTQSTVSETQSEIDVNEMLKEWCIPFDDLLFKERIRHGRHGDIFRGQWHGDVLIYTFNNYKENEMNIFREEIAELSLIRHENIMLFMGASLVAPNLAVITSVCQGISLYEQIHMKNKNVAMSVKMNIARQIAQGMGYLHARGVVHKRLNSHNVTIHNSRAKIYLMDQGMSKKDCDRNDYGCLPRGHLSYLSPELMRSLRVDPPYVFSEREYTQESDIYAFGSILFELLLETYAFNQTSSDSMIWLVGTGHYDQSVHKLKVNSPVKELIIKCWSLNQFRRPRFSLIVRELTGNIPFHAWRCSEPERINRIGLCV